MLNLGSVYLLHLFDMVESIVDAQVPAVVERRSFWLKETTTI